MAATPPLPAPPPPPPLIARPGRGLRGGSGRRCCPLLRGRRAVQVRLSGVLCLSLSGFRSQELEELRGKEQRFLLAR